MGDSFVTNMYRGDGGAWVAVLVNFFCPSQANKQTSNQTNKPNRKILRSINVTWLACRETAPFTTEGDIWFEQAVPALKRGIVNPTRGSYHTRYSYGMSGETEMAANFHLSWKPISGKNHNKQVRY